MIYEDTFQLDEDELSEHVGHSITVGIMFDDAGNELRGYSLDCHTCGEVLGAAHKSDA